MGSSAFGPARYGQPSSPSAPTFQSNPDKYQSYDRSALANRAVSNATSDIGNEQNRAMAKAIQLNGGRSASNVRTNQDIAAQGENRIADMRNQAGLAGFGEKLQQMAGENQFNLGNFQAQLQKYATDAALSEQERQNRRSAIGNLPGGSLINLFGNY